MFNEKKVVQEQALELPRTVRKYKGKLAEFKVAIICDNHFDDYKLLEKVCDHMLSKRPMVTVTSISERSGNAVRLYARHRNFPLIKVMPDWDKDGKSAAFKRNEKLVKEADAVIMFTDGPYQNSLDIQSKAKVFNKAIKVVNYSNK